MKRTQAAGLVALWLATSASAADFTGAASTNLWQAAHDVAPLSASPEGLLIRIIGPDPHIISQPINYGSGTPLFLRMRLRSEASGTAQVFFFNEQPTEAASQKLEVPVSEWHEVALALPQMRNEWRFRFDPPGTNGQCVIASWWIGQVGSVGVTHVAATASELRLTLKNAAGDIRIAELAPFQSLADAAGAPKVMNATADGTMEIALPRFDGQRDRLYSGFVALQSVPRVGLTPLGVGRYVEEFHGVARNETSYPRAASKKGLQVQIVDDALALGIKHAALNFNLASLLQTKPTPESVTWKMDGETYYFNRHYLESLPVKRFSDADVLVNLIVLYYTGGNKEADVFMTHPNYSTGAPNGLTAFNTLTPDGVRHFKACMEFLADYFTRPDGTNGRVWGYIIGNEVNAHWEWYNLGRAHRDAVVNDYLRTVRLANTAVRKSSTSARVYLSLTHFWTEVMQKDPSRSCGGKELLDEFNRRAKLGGDFDWHLAHHPYPENLFEPRTWRDKSPTNADGTPKITFKNLEVLDAYFRRPEMLYRGQPRRIVLSEQGFHCPDKPEGELWQAAAYCYAWEKAKRLDGIDAFILHRHVDHGREGGLNLGLWTRKRDSLSTPDRPRRIYDVFRAADTPEREKAFEFALPVIGITNWDQVLPAQ
jgi:uncharacterized protein DUF5722